MGKRRKHPKSLASPPDLPDHTTSSEVKAKKRKTSSNDEPVHASTRRSRNRRMSSDSNDDSGGTDSNKIEEKQRKSPDVHRKRSDLDEAHGSTDGSCDKGAATHDQHWSSSGKWKVQKELGKDSKSPDHKIRHTKSRSLAEKQQYGIDTSPQAMSKKSEHRFSKESLRIFPLADPTGALLILDHPECVTLKGKVNVRCICGTINIFGYSIKSDGTTHPIYSANSNSLLTIESTEGYEGNVFEAPDLLSLVEHDPNWKLELQNASLCHSPVIVHLQKLDDQALDFLCGLNPYQSLFSDDRGKSEMDAVDLNSVGVRLYRPGAPVRCMNITNDFDNIRKWLSSRLLKGSSPVIVVCGGSNVGKSTLTRYLLNYTLNMVKEVAYLECDVGQTEFTPPGCVSVSRITQPILGPPFTHQHPPSSCCYLGEVSPGDNPEYYMRCVTFVHNKFMECDEKYPLVVNTMGWNKGMGLALLTDTLRLVKPDLVVQIDSTKQYKNLPLITSDFIAENIGWTTQTLTSSEDLKPHSLISVKCVVDTLTESNDRFKPFDHRNMSLLAYLGQSFTKSPAAKSFGAICPHVVPWKQVAVHVSHASIANSQIFYALNASLVALCVVDEDQMIVSEKEEYPRFLRKTPVCSCLGLGVIRAIDMEKKVFYLVTPLPSSECQRVNCLLRGAVEISQQLLLNQKHSSVPYVGYPKDGIGATAVSKRRHTIRWRPNNNR